MIGEVDSGAHFDVDFVIPVTLTVQENFVGCDIEISVAFQR